MCIVLIVAQLSDVLLYLREGLCRWAPVYSQWPACILLLLVLLFWITEEHRGRDGGVVIFR